MTVAASCPSNPCEAAARSRAAPHQEFQLGPPFPKHLLPLCGELPCGPPSGEMQRRPLPGVHWSQGLARDVRHEVQLSANSMFAPASPGAHCSPELVQGARREAQRSAQTQFGSATPLRTDHLKTIWMTSLMTLVTPAGSCPPNPCASQSRAVLRPEFHLGPRCAKQLLPLCGELQCGPLNHLKMKNHLKTLWMMTLTTLMTRAAARPLSPCGSSSPGLAQGHAAQKLPSASVPVLPPPMGHSKALSTALMTWAP
mmetsp:Transcript_37054/g.85655  ORF Transcript_37054/g.85655 Transcript_37054/m.85655 type:complete len:255 (-) Transcript_37054:424-1188(-)